MININSTLNIMIIYLTVEFQRSSQSSLSFFRGRPSSSCAFSSWLMAVSVPRKYSPMFRDFSRISASPDTCPSPSAVVMHRCRASPKHGCQVTIATYSNNTTHVHTRLMALCPGLPGWASTRKVKPIWNLLKQETVSGSGISWAICKSAPRSREITTPAPHCSLFHRPNALPATQPMTSVYWRQMLQQQKQFNNHFLVYLCLLVFIQRLMRSFCSQALRQML